MSKVVDFSALRGEVIEVIDGLEKGSEEVQFFTASGKRFTMDHTQDCCESVSVEEVIGNPGDILGREILLAEEVTNKADGEKIDRGQVDFRGEPYVVDSGTWTFYKLATITGAITIRWLGESNGYYSESVDFRELVT